MLDNINNAAANDNAPAASSMDAALDAMAEQMMKDLANAKARAARWGVDEVHLDDVAASMVRRDMAVKMMSLAPAPFSPSWNRASERIAREDAFLARFGLV